MFHFSRLRSMWFERKEWARAAPSSSSSPEPALCWQSMSCTIPFLRALTDRWWSNGLMTASMLVQEQSPTRTISSMPPRSSNSNTSSLPPCIPSPLDWVQSLSIYNLLDKWVMSHCIYDQRLTWLQNLSKVLQERISSCTIFHGNSMMLTWWHYLTHSVKFFPPKYTWIRKLKRAKVIAWW